jgi:hypothetical protein
MLKLNEFSHNHYPLRVKMLVKLIRRGNSVKQIGGCLYPVILLNYLERILWLRTTYSRLSILGPDWDGLRSSMKLPTSF